MRNGRNGWGSNRWQVNSARRPTRVLGGTKAKRKKGTGGIGWVSLGIARGRGMKKEGIEAFCCYEGQFYQHQPVY